MDMKNYFAGFSARYWNHMFHIVVEKQTDKCTLTISQEVREIDDILMSNGEIFSGEEIGKLTKQIINVFADKKMSVDKSKIILKRASELLGEYSVVEFTDL